MNLVYVLAFSQPNCILLIAIKISRKVKSTNIREKISQLNLFLKLNCLCNKNIYLFT